MSLPMILFFARGYQADYFPTLVSDRYDAVFVTMTRAERLAAERRDVIVEACFEEDFASLPVAPIPADYLLTSFISDRFLGRFDHARRREILGKEISFWAQLLDRHRPAAVVNELVAIEISEVLLIETKQRDIRYLAGMNCVVDDWFYWLNDPISLSGRHLTNAEPNDEAQALAQDYITKLHAKDYKPFYVQNLAGRRSLRPLLAAVVKLGLWNWRALGFGGFRYELYVEEYAKKIAVYLKSLVLSYDRLDQLPEAKEVIFYPLHQEPEATLNYMSEFYSNQVATIENILKCLTPEQILVVKEHPVDKGSLLRSKFWALRKQYSSLFFLPAELHGREVLRRATRVVTLTSTVGWEAAATGKQVYVLGQIFYDAIDGVTPIDSFDALKSALRAPVADNPGIAPEVLQAFVARMTAGSYPGNPFPHDALYSETNRQRIIDAIADGAGL
jgi:hypothetical protein